MKRITLYFSLFILFFIIGCGINQDYQIRITNLSEGELVSKDSLSISYAVSPADWREKGYSVHFLLDRKHLKIARNKNHITYKNLTKGAHAVFAMVCDQNGISLKNHESIAVCNFFIKEKTSPLIHTDKPLLVLHQPQKKTFRGKEGLKILFDFRVLNVTLGDNYHVHYNIDGLDYYLDQEKHVWIKEARRIGGHELSVRLESHDGKLVNDNPFNAITKEFLVVEK